MKVKNMITNIKEKSEGIQTIKAFIFKTLIPFFSVLVYIISHGSIYRHNNELMKHMGLSLLTVALETGSDHISASPSLLSLVKDDMCKNIFAVRILS